MVRTKSCWQDGVALTLEQSRKWHEPLDRRVELEYASWLEPQLERLEARFIDFQTAHSVSASLLTDRASRGS